MSNSTAIALLALVIALFAVFAAGAVYARLRLLERTALSPGSTRLQDEALRAPEALWPRDGDIRTLVLLLDGTCPTCEALAEAVATRAYPDLRTVALVATPQAASSFTHLTSLDILTDATCAAALSEGYTPCLFLIDKTGQVTDRRFVYADTDIPALLAELCTPSIGSNHAA